MFSSVRECIYRLSDLASNKTNLGLPIYALVLIWKVAKADTDHTTGIGLVAITGRYDSKLNSFRVESSYALGGHATAHAEYGVTDEEVLSLGLESRFKAFGRRNTVDMEYFPHSDKASMKLSVRQSRVKVSAILNFAKFRTDTFKGHSERYELDARLNNKESVKMTFNARNSSAKFKFLRKLDPRNRVDITYNYERPSQRFVTLCFNHFYSKRHTFALTANYGASKYSLEWDCKTSNGPWTISTDFLFDRRYVFMHRAFRLCSSSKSNCISLNSVNRSPHIGEWHIKRRFEF